MRRNSDGFTLVELLLATALFSFILLFVTTGFIQINRAYNKGITVKRIHQSAREVMEEITLSMLSSTSQFPMQRGTAQYGGGAYSSEWICIGNNLTFEWVKGYVEPNNNFFNLARQYNHCGEIGNSADAYPIAGSQAENLLDELVAVQDIKIEPISETFNTYKIIIQLASNDVNTDFSSTQPCDPTDSYCDFVTLSTVVTLRR